MILNAAVETIHQEGHENLNVRKIAKKLNCSTQPILYNFKTLDEMKEETYKRADQIHSSFISPKPDSSNPLLEMGLNYIRFGVEESNLFRFLFQNNQFQQMDINALIEHESLNPVIEGISRSIGCNRDYARTVFLSIFAMVHGLASLLANNSLQYDETEISRMLESAFEGLKNLEKQRNVE